MSLRSNQTANQATHGNESLVSVLYWLKSGLKFGIAYSLICTLQICVKPLYAEPQKATPKAGLSSSLESNLHKNKINSRERRSKRLPSQRTEVYKKIPFEPVTENRLRSNKDDDDQTTIKEHLGDNWLEFIIKKNDTLYSLVRRNGLSIKDLFAIMHVGKETRALKLIRPGQKLLIHASDKNILEIIHHQTRSRQLHVTKKNDVFSGVTMENGIRVEIPDPPTKRNLLAAYPVLRKQTDQSLQTQLETTIQQLGLMPQIANKKLAVALVDITNLNNPKLAMLNGDEMMYAASLPKIAILLGAFVEIEKGNMQLDNETRESMTQMIRYSSNENASKMLEKVGNHRLQEILMSDRFKLYDPTHNGGLWVGKSYGKTPAFERDPLHNLSHGATVLQAARFYYLMETGQIVSTDLTNSMKEIMSQPEINHKFVKGLATRPKTKIYRKSGSWRQFHSDSALIESNGYKYIVVAMAENPKGGEWLVDMITPLHDLIVPKAYANLGNN